MIKNQINLKLLKFKEHKVNRRKEELYKQVRRIVNQINSTLARRIKMKRNKILHFSQYLVKVIKVLTIQISVYLEIL